MGETYILHTHMHMLNYSNGLHRASIYIHIYVCITYTYMCVLHRHILVYYIDTYAYLH